MSRRRLPHWYPEGSHLFLTWHLHGSLPASSQTPPGSLSSGQAFVWLDRQLDTPREGPMYLRRLQIAQIVVDSIKEGVHLGHYERNAYVIMANHVHLLIRPLIAPDRLPNRSKAPPPGRQTDYWEEPANPSGRSSPTITGCGMTTNSGKSSAISKLIRSRPDWFKVRRIIPAPAQASTRVSTRHAKVRAPPLHHHALYPALGRPSSVSTTL